MERAGAGPIAVEELRHLERREPAELWLWSGVVGAHLRVDLALRVGRAREGVTRQLADHLVNDLAWV